MAIVKARSPSYPSIGLKEAIEKAQAVYNKDYQNQVPRAVAAEHMGYASLNGKSLGVLAALLKYGLLEGRGDNTRVSDLALRIIAHGPGDTERAEAIRDAAARPELFAELDKRYPDGRGSDAAIRSYLLTQKFIPQAADSALRSYRETKTLVQTECGAYDSGASEPDGADDFDDLLKSDAPKRAAVVPTPPQQNESLAMGVQERVLQSGMLSKTASYRVIVSGPVGEAEIDRLLKKLEMDKEILADADPEPHQHDL
jgi:hypothetical protein